MQHIPHLVHYTHVDGPHAGHKGEHHHLNIIARDQPETDSHIKQIATQIGGWINHPQILVTKEGKDGINVWPIRNRYHDGGPAHPDVIFDPMRWIIPTSPSSDLARSVDQDPGQV